MKTRYRYIIILLSIFCGRMVFAQEFVDKQTPVGILPDNKYLGEDWVLDFSDEFNSNSIDNKKWEIDNSTNSRGSNTAIGVNSWYWTPDNLELRDGKLVLKVTKEKGGVMKCAGLHGYTSGKGVNYGFTYGYVEGRIKIAESSKGTHTALWMSGHGQKFVDGTCNDGAEIDIVESTELTDNSHLALYWDGYGTSEAGKASRGYSAPGIHDGKFHTFGLLWTPNLLRAYYDGEFVAEYTKLKYMVRAEEYLWISCGLSWIKSGSMLNKITFKDDPIGFLTEAEFDYVRVWKKKDIGNLVKNGNFIETGYDDGTTVWLGPHMYNGGIVFDRDNTAINAPTARFSGVGLERYIYQDIKVNPDTDYLLKFTARTQDYHSENGTTNSKHSKIWADIISTKDNAVLYTLLTDSNENKTLEGYFHVPDDVSSIRLKFTKDIGIAYLDDVSIMEKKNINYPVVSINKNMKILIISGLMADTKVKIISPNGNIKNFSKGNNKITYYFGENPLGIFTINISGDIDKTFTINTSKIK